MSGKRKDYNDCMESTGGELNKKSKGIGTGNRGLSMSSP